MGCAREALEPFARDADVRGKSETFLFGERETYADVVAACWLAWLRRMWGADTQEWAELHAEGGDGSQGLSRSGSMWIHHLRLILLSACGFSLGFDTPLRGPDFEGLSRRRLVVSDGVGGIVITLCSVCRNQRLFMTSVERERVIWRPQPFSDNYVPPLFLSALYKNHKYIQFCGGVVWASTRDQ